MRGHLRHYGAFPVLFMFLLSLCLLPACSDKKDTRQQASVKNLIALTKNAAIKRSKNKKILAQQAITYQNKDKRSPFQEDASLTYSSSTLEALGLHDVPVKSLKFLGTITRQQKRWAVIETPAGKIYRLEVGDKIGREEGKIIKIFKDKIRVGLSEGAVVLRRHHARQHA